MKLSIIRVCCNEATTLERILKKVHEAPVGDREAILVDDGSTDGTRELIGSPDDLGLRGFHIVGWNVAWFEVIYPFLTELFDIKIQLRPRTDDPCSDCCSRPSAFMQSPRTGL